MVQVKTKATEGNVYNRGKSSAHINGRVIFL
jgi:hypothetical protein